MIDITSIECMYIQELLMAAILDLGAILDMFPAILGSDTIAKSICRAKIRIYVKLYDSGMSTTYPLF